MDIGQFIKDRNEALLSLDETKIKAYIKKYGIQNVKPEVFWITVHKSITGCEGLPIEFRRKSKIWLIDREFNSLDDGDL